MPAASPQNASSSRSQPAISAFFTQQPSPAAKVKSGKRPISPIDLTFDSSDGEPPAKMSKNSGHSPFFGRISSEHHAEAGPSRTCTGAAEQWRHLPSSPEKLEPLPMKPRNAADEAARQMRHEQFKKKLIGENNPFLQKRSDVDDADGMEVDSRGIVENDVDETEASGGESDEAFKQLTAIFSDKWGKGKATGTIKRKKKVQEVGPSGQTYTPLEQQVFKLKESNPGTVLMVEVGYKYKFFGDDAKVAAKELGMVCFTDRNFLVASIPTHRRTVHLKKLLSQGYRVGIVDQVETAALKKVSERRNTPFDRKLTHLYTAATYVDDLGSVDDVEWCMPPPFMCIIEENTTANGADVYIGMITICPSTGDVVWDEFEDTLMRTELETRLVHTKPTELLLPDGGLTKPTEKMLAHFTGVSAAGDKIRTERFKGIMSYTNAFSFVSEFYTDKKKSAAASESFKSGKLMAAVTNFPKRVVIALAHAIKHLSAFSLADAFLETEFFSKFTTRAHMLLAANTLNNLEIFCNETDHNTRGSLMWILDRTKTKFGARLLKGWVGRPLVDKAILQDRVDAVEEIISSSSEKLVVLRGVLKNLPDLAKGLCRIQYGQCTPQEIAILLPAFNKLASVFDTISDPSDVGFKSNVLNDIVFSLPKLKEPLNDLLGVISLKKASEGRKDTMWNDPERYPAIADADLAIQTIEVELMDELKSIRKFLKKPALKWTSIAGEEFVVEVKRNEERSIPSTWHLVSKTKHTARYHTLEVKRKLQERSQYKETLQAEAHRAFLSFLDEIAQKYYGIMREAVNKDNYVRPQFTDDDTLEIIEGRHPMVEALRSDPFVPNTVRMGGIEPRSKIITGPNMGGKSSSVRMIALIAIMAQIGSYVPAKSVKLGMLDSILTRMGASDDLARGRSTFMVEMSETSDILHTATQKSLVILDELGRGTSTFDGMAIASAVLQQLVETTKCKTLFITHYPLVAARLESKFPLDVQNLHMGYTAESHLDGTRDITFLYRLTSGVASESFGIECGRLAGLPEPMLLIATQRASHLQAVVQERTRRNKIRKGAQLVNRCLVGSESVAIEAIQELQMIVTSESMFMSPLSIANV